MAKKIRKTLSNIKWRIIYTWRHFFRRNQGSGMSCLKSEKYQTIKLQRDPKDVIGKGLHRTGWPWVFKHLQTIHSDKGILFDDFFEQNFCYKDKPDIYNEPWVTIMHHPANIPLFGNYREKLDVAFESNEFKESEPNLKLVIALSESLACWLRTKLVCKVVVMKHPANIHIDESWFPNKSNQIYQLGFYLRNTQLAEQVKIPDNYKITKLWNKLSWLKEYDNKVRNYWETKIEERKVRNSVGKTNFVLPTKYDEILNSGIVLAEYFEVSASNVVLECICHNTPLIVNRKPAIEEYLGVDYPLFYDDIDEIPGLIEKAQEGHFYLKNLPKEDLDINFFLERIKEEIHKI